MWKVMTAIGLVFVSLSLAACDDKASEETTGTTTGESTGEGTGETGTATTTEGGG